MNILQAMLAVGMVILLATGWGLRFMQESLKKKGRIRLVLWDPDLNSWDVRYPKTPTGNEVVQKVDGIEKRFMLPQKGRVTADIPTWVNHPRHGYSFIPPSDAETVEKDDVSMMLAIANPASYHLAQARNRPRDSLNAGNKEADPWIAAMPFIIFGGLAALVIIIGMLVYVISHLGK